MIDCSIQCLVFHEELGGNSSLSEPEVEVVSRDSIIQRAFWAKNWIWQCVMGRLPVLRSDELTPASRRSPLIIQGDLSATLVGQEQMGYTSIRRSRCNWELCR